MIAHMAENDRVRCAFPDDGGGFVVVIDLNFSVRTFSAGAVKPGDEEIFAVGTAVGGQEFPELVAVEFVIGFSGAVGFLVAIPRGEVKTEFETIFLRGFCKFADNVAFPV